MPLISFIKNHHDEKNIFSSGIIVRYCRAFTNQFLRGAVHQVNKLFRDDVMLEIEATAIIPKK